MISKEMTTLPSQWGPPPAVGWSVPEPSRSIKNNCFSDVKETKEKIANGLLKTDYEDTWIINFISLLCKVQNGRIDQIYEGPYETNKNFFLHYGDITDSILIFNLIKDII